jgi:hypothetical protein
LFVYLFFLFFLHFISLSFSQASRAETATRPWAQTLSSQRTRRNSLCLTCLFASTTNSLRFSSRTQSDSQPSSSISSESRRRCVAAAHVSADTVLSCLPCNSLSLGLSLGLHLVRCSFHTPHHITVLLLPEHESMLQCLPAIITLYPHLSAHMLTLYTSPH